MLSIFLTQANGYTGLFVIYNYINLPVGLI